jgi:hypothetical protein
MGRVLIARRDQAGSPPNLCADSEDQIGAQVEIGLRALVAGIDFETFRPGAHVFLRAHEDHATVHRLRMNLPGALFRLPAVRPSGG